MLGDLQGPIGVLGGGRYLKRGDDGVLGAAAARFFGAVASHRSRRGSGCGQHGWIEIYGHRPALRRAGRGRGIVRARAGRKSEMRGIKMATPMRTRKYTRAATTDSKSGKLASNFGKLLENDFCMFCQILKDGKSFTKLLEML